MKHLIQKQIEDFQYQTNRSLEDAIRLYVEENAIVLIPAEYEIKEYPQRTELYHLGELIITTRTDINEGQAHFTINKCW